jgi:chaperone modulatory protein CbpM
MANTLISGVIIENGNTLTLTEFSHAIRIKEEVVIEMVEYEVLHPEGKNPQEWRFGSLSLTKGKKAASFYRDLDINMTGISMILELLERIEELEGNLKIRR